MAAVNELNDEVLQLLSSHESRRLFIISILSTSLVIRLASQRPSASQLTLLSLLVAIFVHLMS